MSEIIQLEVSLTPHHLSKYASITRNQGKLTFLLGVFLIVVIIIGIKLVSADYFAKAVTYSFFIGLFTPILLVIISCSFFCKWNQSSKVFGPFIFTIDSFKIVSIAGYTHIEHPWSAVDRIVRHEGVILVFFDPHLAHIIPESAIEDPNALYQKLQAWLNVSHNNAHFKD